MSSSTLPEVGQEGQRLGRRARLGGDQVQRRAGSDARRSRRCTASGSVESRTRTRDARVADAGTTRQGPRARASEPPMPHTTTSRETLARAMPSREGLSSATSVRERGGRVEPAEAVARSARRPPRRSVQSVRVPRPDAAGPALVDGARDGRVDGACAARRQAQRSSDRCPWSARLVLPAGGSSALRAPACSPAGEMTPRQLAGHDAARDLRRRGSAVKPKCSKISLGGRREPEAVDGDAWRPPGRPSGPSPARRRPRCSRAACRSGGRTSSRYAAGCAAKRSQQGIETTRVRMPSPVSSVARGHREAQLRAGGDEDDVGLRRRAVASTASAST